MKRFVLALTIPAALILSGCSSSEPEYAASGDETSPSVTTSLDAARALNLDMAPATSEVVRAPIVEPTSEPVATASRAESLPREAQMCRDLVGMMEQFPGTSIEERREALTNLRLESSASEDWKSKTVEEQASMNRAFNAAMTGEC